MDRVRVRDLRPGEIPTAVGVIARGMRGTPLHVVAPIEKSTDYLRLMRGVRRWPDEAQTLADLMRAVVTEGTAPFLRDLPGDPVGAKTGTAEYGSDSPPRTRAWMVGIRGDLAVAVFHEEQGASSASTCC